MSTPTRVLTFQLVTNTTITAFELVVPAPINHCQEFGRLACLVPLDPTPLSRLPLIVALVPLDNRPRLTPLRVQIAVVDDRSTLSLWNALIVLLVTIECSTIPTLVVLVIRELILLTVPPLCVPLVLPVPTQLHMLRPRVHRVQPERSQSLQVRLFVLPVRLVKSPLRPVVRLVRRVQLVLNPIHLVLVSLVQLQR